MKVSLHGVMGFVYESLLRSQHYPDLLDTAEGSHGAFISPVLPLKCSTVCYDEKCPVLSDQPSLYYKQIFGCFESLL